MELWDFYIAQEYSLTRLHVSKIGALQVNFLVKTKESINEFTSNFGVNSPT